MSLVCPMVCVSDRLSPLLCVFHLLRFVLHYGSGGLPMTTPVTKATPSLWNGRLKLALNSLSWGT